MLTPQNAKIMAVVRIEAPRTLAKLDAPELVTMVATQIVEASKKDRCLPCRLTLMRRGHNGLSTAT